MIKNEVNSSREDYLETILIIHNKKGTCLSIDVANYLGFSKPSVSNAVKKLESQQLITRDSDGNLLLTDDGLAIANKVYERHVIFTKMLTGLGVPEDIAEQDACRVEHMISDETFECIKKHFKEKK